MRRTRPRARRGQGGFTLIEIMVSLVISTLLVAMILSIFTSMSTAYRSQAQVAELQQILQAAEATVEADVRQAGYHCAQGFTWAGSPVVGAVPTAVPAINVIDGGTGAQQPDQIAVYYGDPGAQARVINATLPLPGAALGQLTVDSVDNFRIGDVVLLTAGAPLAAPGFETGPRPPEEPAAGDTIASGGKVPMYSACVVQISNINGNVFTFSNAAPWGTTTNSFCTYASVQTMGPTAFSANNNAWLMIYRFVARAYRIDPTRKNLSVLQQSPSGGLIANDWQDLGLGFTNLQVASRWYDPAVGATDNADGDTDAWRNWYSDGQQSVKAAASAKQDGSAYLLAPTALQISMSFVVRTTRPIVDGTVTAATPELQDPTNPTANDIGDSPKVQLAGVADSSRPVELRGNNVYRYATIKIDTRNLGLGR